MGKKWKRLLVQRKRIDASSRPTSCFKEHGKWRKSCSRARGEETPVPEPEVAEEAPVVEEGPVVETPKPKRRRSTRRKKTVSED